MNRFPLRMSLAVLAAGAGLIGAVQAATIVTYSNEYGAGPFTPSWGATVPAGSVLAGLTPSASTVGPSATATSGFVTESSGGLPVLTDGNVGPILSTGGNAVTHAIFASFGNGSGTGAIAGTSVTYTLPAPIQLSSIGIYGGWPDNGRDSHEVNVMYSTDGGQTFTSLSIVANKPGENGVPGVPASTPSAVRTILTDSTGVLAGGALITNLQFNTAFPLGVENGWTGISEFTAYAVPEPATAALGLVGALALLRRRRA